MTAKPSAEPTPRPPVTTTLASASETPPPVSVCDRSGTRTTRSASSSAGVNAATVVCTGAAAAGLDRVRGDRQQLAAPCSRASSSRLPPQRRRVSVDGSPGAAAMQFAASGWSARAAACASTSLPRSLPGAITAAGASRSISSASVRPHASGA